jgi:UDP-2-acetamido-3-amino-2,3-dideoxy-glucuronate N-acetyltransferase
LNKDYFVHESSCIDEDVQIGKGSKIWHFSHLQPGARIGKGCILGQNVNVGSNVVIGNYCKIQNNVSIYEGVELQNYVFCGPSMVFTNIRLPRSEFPQKGSIYYEKTLVKKSASIGANATIICGVTIGEYALIGSGTVVTKDVPDYALVIGNPGVLVGWVNRYGDKLFIDDNGFSICPKSNLKYQLLDNQIKIVDE